MRWSQLYAESYFELSQASRRYQRRLFPEVDINSYRWRSGGPLVAKPNARSKPESRRESFHLHIYSGSVFIVRQKLDATPTTQTSGGAEERTGRIKDNIYYRLTRDKRVVDYSYIVSGVLRTKRISQKVRHSVAICSFKYFVVIYADKLGRMQMSQTK